MKTPPHPGFSVRVDCLEPHGLSVTDGAKATVLAKLENFNPLWSVKDRIGVAMIEAAERDGQLHVELVALIGEQLVATTCPFVASTFSIASSSCSASRWLRSWRTPMPRTA